VHDRENMIIPLVAAGSFSLTLIVMMTAEGDADGGRK